MPRVHRHSNLAEYSANSPMGKKMLHEDGRLGNMYGAGRAVVVTVDKAAIRACVSSWHGRTLRVQETSELQRALAVLAPHEATLHESSAHALRLLDNIRRELAKPERQAA